MNSGVIRASNGGRIFPGESILHWLDLKRAHFLRRTLKVPLFQKIFRRRAHRLFAIFLGSLAFNLYIALHFPLWALLFGPIVLGIPHLISSLRYVPRFAFSAGDLNPKRIYFYFASCFILLAFLRLWLDTHPQTSVLLNLSENAPELLAAGVVVIALALWSSQKWQNIFLAVFVLGILSWLSFEFPLETLGALILIHNFIGFIFWLKAAKTTDEMISAGSALFIFILVTAFILLGGFDEIILGRPTGILGGALNDLSIGPLIFPQASFLLWSRAVSAYSLGQGLHYFVWLKAIPEQHLPSQNPVSFTRSSQFLLDDFGRKGLWMIALATFFVVGFGCLITFPAARVLYIAVAAFHGYFEIAGLVFSPKKITHA